MDIGSQFEDDFFEEPVLRKIKKCTNYETKVFKPYWYMDKVVGDENTHEALMVLKHRADYHYSFKEYAKAAEEYSRCLELVPSSNNTWKREFLENLARSLLKSGDAQKALEWSLKLDESSVNEDQKVVSMNLLALVCHRLGKFQEELEALHSCMHAHNRAPEYWLRLGLCYAGLFKINLPEYSVPTAPEDGESVPNEPCCAFSLKCSQISKKTGERELELPANHPESANDRTSGNDSSSSQAESPVDKCDFCSLGIQIVSSCLIRTKTLLETGGKNRLNPDRDKQIIERISNCLSFMEVDQSFIDIASKMLGGDFLSLTEACGNSIDAQKNCTEAQDPSTEDALL